MNLLIPSGLPAQRSMVAAHPDYHERDAVNLADTGAPQLKDGKDGVQRYFPGAPGRVCLVRPDASVDIGADTITCPSVELDALKNMPPMPSDARERPLRPKKRYSGEVPASNFPAVGALVQRGVHV